MNAATVLLRRQTAREAYDQALQDLRQHTAELGRIRAEWMRERGDRWELWQWQRYCEEHGHAQRARELRETYNRARTAMGNIELRG